MARSNVSLYEDIWKMLLDNLEVEGFLNNLGRWLKPVFLFERVSRKLCEEKKESDGNYWINRRWCPR